MLFTGTTLVLEAVLFFQLSIILIYFLPTELVHVQLSSDWDRD